MPLYLKKGDITYMHCDAIVNATDMVLSGSGGVDRMIHEAAGPDLSLECMKIGYCDVGQAVITKGYDLNAKYVIHTVGPIWSDGNPIEESLLASCYKNALMLALEYKCETVAFPLISAGTFGFPEDDAMRIAKESIEDFLDAHDMTVYLVAYRSHTYNMGAKLFSEVSKFVERNYFDDDFFECACIPEPECYSVSAAPESSPQPKAQAKRPPAAVGNAMPSFRKKPKEASLDDLLNQVDESFAEMLARKIEERGMSNAECYNKANATKSVFSKIKNNPEYKPTKPTVAGFVLALGLSLDEAREMLSKAGYSLSRSNKFDIILEWFITNKIYNIFDINEVLLEYDQQLIGF